MHGYIVSHPVYIDDSNLSELIAMNFVFISMDSENAKKKIIHFLT